jgi:hypothetical protein
MSRRAPIFLGLAIFVTTAQLADLVIQGSGFSLIGVSLIGSLIIPALSTAVWMHFAVMLYNLYFLVQVAFTPTISAL